MQYPNNTELPSTPAPNNPMGAGVVFETRSMHLACALYTIGVEPHTIKKSSQECTPQGHPLTTWVYSAPAGSTEHKEGNKLMATWAEPLEQVDWSKMSDAEKRRCIMVLRAALKNLRFFMGHVAGRGGAQ